MIKNRSEKNLCIAKGESRRQRMYINLVQNIGKSTPD